MNIHPLFVHFPIGLLATYSLLELACLVPWVRRQQWVAPVKMFLLFAGFISSLIGVGLGFIAEGYQPTDKHELIDTHEHFAFASVGAYFLITVFYLLAIQGKEFFKKLTASPLMPLVAFGALTLLVITGALGASIAIGPDVDPFVQFIYTHLVAG